jgi:hypothetical protein
MTTARRRNPENARPRRGNPPAKSPRSIEDTRKNELMSINV